MNEEWPDYLYEVGERAPATTAVRADRAGQWEDRCLTAALEHLSQRREQVRILKRRVALLTGLALLEGGVLLGLLLRYFGG